MDIGEITGKILGGVEEPKRLPLDTEKIRLLIEKIVSRHNLTLKSIEAAGGGDYLAKSVDSTGSRVFSLVRIEVSDEPIGLDSLDDFHTDAVERNSDRSILITNSVFTGDAKLFAAEKSIILVDGKELGSILAEDEWEIEKAFVSGKTDEEVLEYFESKRKKKRLGIGREESIEEINRRYSPVVCYLVAYTGEEVVEKTHVYVDLTFGDIYRIHKEKLERIDIIRRIMNLPEGARELLIELLMEEELDQEHINGKDLEILKKRKLIQIETKEETKGLFQLIIDEILDILRITSHGISEIGTGGASKSKTVEGAKIKTKFRKMVSPGLKLKKFDNAYDLEFYVNTSRPGREFEPDEIKYDKEVIARILDAITEEKEEVNLKYLIYMPYYKCSYLSQDRYRYLRYSPLWFKEKKKRGRARESHD